MPRYPCQVVVPIGSRPIDLHLKGLEAMGLRLVRQLVISKPRPIAYMELISTWTSQVLVLTQNLDDGSDSS